MSKVSKYFGQIGLILVLLHATACSHPTGVPTVGTTQPNEAPFRPDTAGNPALPATLPDSTAEGGLPFHDSQNLPAGTLLTVRLKNAITAEASLTGSTFEAVIDEPVVINGNTVITKGAVAAGRIESARISEVKPHRGYIRLALDSIQVAGIEVPVQTASLFARQIPQSDSVIRLEKGRRLTFRLAEPVYLSTQRAQAGH